MLDAATGGATTRPCRQRQPAIRTRLECRDRRYLHRSRIVLEIMIQEGPQHMQPEILGRVAAEANLTDRAAVEAFLVVEPGTDDQIKIRIGGRPRFERLVQS